ncbi:MAG: hypothetical protein ACHQ4J_16420 [Candidatus Binatia bacterium]
MRLGVRPAVFLGRLVVFFFLAYLLFLPLGSAYAHLLAFLTQGFLHLTEISSDPNLNQATQMWVRGTDIFYMHRLFPKSAGIPAEWVQANLVLLIPLMLATPARSYRQRFVRLGLALAIALGLQVLDIAVTVKFFYASELGWYSQRYYGSLRRLYQFGDAFTESMDTQLFPFVIWAGIHFNQLLGRGAWAPAPAPAAATVASTEPTRRKDKPAKKAAGAR